MRQLFLAAALIASSAWCAEAPTPSQMYMVSAAFSDHGGLFYYRVVDVQPDGRDVVIRYSRIGWTDPAICPRKIVQSAQVRLRNRTIKDLVKRNNPCAVKPQDLAATVRKYSIRGGHFETFSVGVVATCGPMTSVLELPDESRVNLAKVKSANRTMGRLWDLVSDIVNPAFGEGDVFQGLGADDSVLQRAGQEIAPELASGRYDQGLEAAVRGNDLEWEHPRMRDLLTDYHGPRTDLGLDSVTFIALINAEQYRFRGFAKPGYPRLAAMAHIQGDVSLQLSVDPSTGKVSEVDASSGNQLLRDSASAAAKEWRFEPNSVSPGKIGITLRYSLQCK